MQDPWDASRARKSIIPGMQPDPLLVASLHDAEVIAKHLLMRRVSSRMHGLGRTPLDGRSRRASGAAPGLACLSIDLRWLAVCYILSLSLPIDLDGARPEFSARDAARQEFPAKLPGKAF